MADIFGISHDDRNTLCTAALLHDITKEKTPEEHINLCRVYNIEYTETYVSTPALFHAKTGAALSLELFPDICTNKVADIISAHTTGCKAMTLLQKMLFLADSTEATRTHSQLQELRIYFYQKPPEKNWYDHIDDACIMSIDGTVCHLIKKGEMIDTQTISARNYLIEKRGIR